MNPATMHGNTLGESLHRPNFNIATLCVKYLVDQ